MYLGNYATGTNIEYKFTTRDTNSVLTDFAGAILTVYQGTGYSHTTSGVSVITGFNNTPGLNRVLIIPSTNLGFYTSGTDFNIVVSGGSVAGTSMIGEVIANFSIQNRYDNLYQANGIENNYSLQQSLRLILSAVAAKLTGAETDQVGFRDINDTKTRILATVTPTGNRTSFVYNVT